MNQNLQEIIEQLQNSLTQVQQSLTILHQNMNLNQSNHIYAHQLQTSNDKKYTENKDDHISKAHLTALQHSQAAAYHSNMALQAHNSVKTDGSRSNSFNAGQPNHTQYYNQSIKHTFDA